MEFGRCFLEHILATATDVNRGTQFEESLGHRFAKPGAAAGDEDALTAEKCRLEHSFDASLIIPSVSPFNIRPILTPKKRLNVDHIAGTKIAQISAQGIGELKMAGIGFPGRTGLILKIETVALGGDSHYIRLEKNVYFRLGDKSEHRNCRCLAVF
jgi:hypothetical protein